MSEVQLKQKRRGSLTTPRRPSMIDLMLHISI